MTIEIFEGESVIFREKRIQSFTKTIDTISPYDSVNCPNCNQLISPDDLTNKNYTMLGSYFNLKSNNEFTIVVQCETCNKAIKDANFLYGVSNDIQNKDYYEGKLRAELIFKFKQDYLENDEQYKKDFEALTRRLEQYYNNLLQNQGNSLKSKPHCESKKIFVDHFKEWQKKLSFQGNLPDNSSLGTHCTILNRKSIRDKINIMTHCPESRLDTYKGKGIDQYVREKDLDAADLNQVQNCVKETVDSELVTYKATSLTYLKGPRRFSTAISEQGSGVRSTICLASDLISEKDSQIILIDEPELGLNPAAKRKIIEFLQKQISNKQIFIATHDPIFVNPKLWPKESFSLYLFSVVKNEFVKIDPNQNKQDPNVFGGYLPHTVCVKDFHLYVEGTLDVYIHQFLFKTFLEKEATNFNWDPLLYSQILNRVEIFHLGGDFWSHLLHTVPQKPYKTMLVFDGDKKDDVIQLIDSFNKNRQNNLPKFGFINNLNPLSTSFNGEIPVIILQRQTIEDYLQPKPKDKKDGPKIAMNMHSIPNELENLYRTILMAVCPEKRNAVTSSITQKNDNAFQFY